jgi:ADP-ribose pyrophosphatase YjhB (NUDIX family)
MKDKVTKELAKQMKLMVETPEVQASIKKITDALGAFSQDESGNVVRNEPVTQKLVKDSCCSYCGTKLYSPEYPKKCSNCGEYAWGNPIPVVVIVFPVVQDDKLGILIQKRGIDPKKGEWALTSGYVNNNEDWQTAAGRESFEEMGLVTDINKFQLYDVVSGKDKVNTLIFCVYEEALTLDILSSFKPNNEVDELDVMWLEKDLAFPSHTQVANTLIKTLGDIYKNPLMWQASATLTKVVNFYK